MNNNFEGLTLKTSRLTKRSWLVDSAGVRRTERFKVLAQNQTGALTMLATDKGSIIYSNGTTQHIMHFLLGGYWNEIVKLSDELYLLGWRAMHSLLTYYPVNPKLEYLLKDYAPFYAFQMLTANLMGVQTEKGWGIIDITTGRMVEEPKYFKVEVRDGKIIGKTKQTMETEIKIDN